MSITNEKGQTALLFLEKVEAKLKKKWQSYIPDY